MNEEQMSPEEQAMQQQAGMAPEQAMPQEQGMDEMQAQQSQQIQQIAATAPQPDKPYTYKAIDKFADAMNDFVAKVDPNLSPNEYDPPEGETKLDGPLPPEVYVPYAVIMSFVAQLGDFDKFIVQPEDLVSDTALAKATANFGRMAKDKKLMEALQASPEGAEEMEEPEMSVAEMETGRMPDDVDDEDKEIMNMM